SGIGRSVALHFAKEGSDIAIVYLEEDEDARKTKKMVEDEGQKCLLISGDVRQTDICKELVETCVSHFIEINMLINNAVMQFHKNHLEDNDDDQLRKTFETNIFSDFLITKTALKHLKEGDVIINPASVTAYRGSPHLLDYSSTKGAIVSFTR